VLSRSPDQNCDRLLFCFEMIPSPPGKAHSHITAAKNPMVQPDSQKDRLPSFELSAPWTLPGSADTIGTGLMAHERNVNSVLQPQIRGSVDRVNGKFGLPFMFMLYKDLCGWLTVIPKRNRLSGEFEENYEF